ncbi:MAG: rRNA maturation RNase YbeY [Paludibacteraceae bacterium]|nr:rRNA maturation RNase YbeY [Paludibacteraceae bacterium]
MITLQTDGVEMLVLDKTHLQRWIGAVAASYGFAVGKINYIFCSDERELEVNRQFLGHDYYTDVITFDYSSEHVLSGDIFISLDTVRSNAEQIGTTFENELYRVLIHGVLHLTGQEDKTPDAHAEMTRKEDLALEML